MKSGIYKVKSISNQPNVTKSGIRPSIPTKYVNSKRKVILGYILITPSLGKISFFLSVPVCCVVGVVVGCVLGPGVVVGSVGVVVVGSVGVVVVGYLGVIIISRGVQAAI
jgi:hypothetical protein